MKTRFIAIATLLLQYINVFKKEQFQTSNKDTLDDTQNVNEYRAHKNMYNNKFHGKCLKDASTSKEIYLK